MSAAHQGPAENAAVRAAWSALGALVPHARRADLSGQTIGEWRVIDGPRTLGRGSNRGAAWLVECIVCGALAVQSARALIRTRPRCAPYRTPRTIEPERWSWLAPMPASKRNRPAMLGERHGTLVVVDGPRSARAITGRTQARWLCACDCGRRKVTGAYELQSGNVRSCGHCKAPPLPPPPRWGQIVALACVAARRPLGFILREARVDRRHATAIEAVLDGAAVRRGSALERRLARIAVVSVPERDCLRLGMTPEAIEQALALSIAEESDGDGIADVARRQAARLARCAA